MVRTVQQLDNMIATIVAVISIVGHTAYYDSLHSNLIRERAIALSHLLVSV